jgi:O-antigen/teichoic acid export membrane protein
MPETTGREPSELTRRAVTGFAWSLASSGGQIVVRVGVFVVLARLLAPAEFGLVASAAIAIGVLQTLAVLGVGSALVQRSEISALHVRTGHTLLTLFGLAFTAATFALAPFFAGFMRTPGLAPLLRLLSFDLLLVGVAHASESLLAREMRFRRLALIQFGSYAAGYGAVGITGARLGYGAYALVAAHLSTTLLSSAATLLSRPVPLRPSLDARAARDLLGFGTGLTVAKIANGVALQGDNFVVGRWLGVEAVGFYNRAYQLMAMPANVLAQAIDKVLFPAMSSVQDDGERMRTAFGRVLGATLLAALPASALMVVLAPEIVAVFLGEKWRAVVVPFQILAAGTFFRVGYKVGSVAILARGRANLFAATQITYACLIAAGAAIGSRFGLGGVAAAVAVALVVQYALVTALSARLLGIDPWPVAAMHARGLIAAALAAGIAWGGAFAARAHGLPDWSVIAAVCLAVAGVAAVVARAAPGALGRDAAFWMESLVRRKAPQAR